jgi:hypothetical protein
MLSTIWSYIAWVVQVVQSALLPKPVEEAQLGGRRFKLVKLLGEGGYAFVHLAKEQPTSTKPSVDGSADYAIKKASVCMHAGSSVKPSCGPSTA